MMYSWSKNILPWDTQSGEPSKSGFVELWWDMGLSRKWRSWFCSRPCSCTIPTASGSATTTEAGNSGALQYEILGAQNLGQHRAVSNWYITGNATKWRWGKHTDRLLSTTDNGLPILDLPHGITWASIQVQHTGVVYSSRLDSVIT